MKLIAAALLLTLATSAVLADTADFKCKYQVTRKEWRQLSPEERSDYITAVQRLYDPRYNPGHPRGFSVHDDFAYWHDANSRVIHSSAIFLPIHRYMVAHYEQELQRVMGKAIAVPYWNWSLDSQSPETAPVFRSDAFGGRGSTLGNCIKEGPLSKIKKLYPTKECLKRSFNKGMGHRLGSFSSPEAINSLIMSNKDYDSFRSKFEANAHATVHVNMGGDMGTMHSPADPLFFLHHAYVDKIYWDWQKVYGATNYNGHSGLSGQSVRASPNEVFAPRWKGRVSDTFDTTTLCYTYEDIRANQVRPQLPVPTVPVPEKKHHHHHGFRNIFNDGVSDPSQVALGATPNVEPLVPLDKKVTVDVRPTPPVTPATDDRTHLTKLRAPALTPEHRAFLEMNGIPVSVAEESIKEETKLVQAINAIPNFVSSAALWNNAPAVSEIIEKSNNTQTTFIAQVGNYDIKVEAGKSTEHGVDQTVSNLKARVKGTAGVEHLTEAKPQVQQKLQNIIGAPALPAEAADNPFVKFNIGRTPSTNSLPVTSAPQTPERLGRKNRNRNI